MVGRKPLSECFYQFIPLHETTMELEKEQQRFFFPSKRDFHLKETKVKIPYMFRLRNEFCIICLDVRKSPVCELTYREALQSFY